MNDRPPAYYSRLAPFARLFLTGCPILTYHHVGPRTPGARLKGLYLSPNLFRRQLGELQDAAFSIGPSPFPDSLATAGPQRRIFLTFDDGFKDVFDHAFPILLERRVSALLFLVSDLLGKTNEWQQRMGDIREPLMDEAQVRDWLAAGQEIGAHTKSHPRLTQLAPAAAREEIGGCKKSLEDRFGLPIKHFCYPYGDWNESVRDLVCEAGYQTACTTDFGVNSSTTPVLSLKRITARYPSRNLKSIWSRLRAGGW
jgi:peptidoglycan/xylan/chitin deacetylase (PgdA/CDA1 family)